MASLGTKVVPSTAYADLGAARYHKRDLPEQKNHFRLRQSLFVIADLCGILSGAFWAIAMRFPEGSTRIGYRSVLPFTRTLAAEHIGVAILYAVLIVLFCHTRKLYSVYPSSSRSRELSAIVKSILTATVLLSGCLFVTNVRDTSRLIIACSAVSALLTMFTWREIRRRSFKRAIADGVTCHNVLIVGTDNLAQALAQHLDHHPEFGFVILGHLSVGAPVRETQDRKLKVLGSISQLKTLCRTHFVDEVLVCAHDRRTVMPLIEDARDCGVGLRIVPDLYDGLAWGARFDYLGDFPTMAVVHRSTPAVAMGLKRLLDVLLAGPALIALSPLLALLALIVKLDSRGPVLYASRRVGKKGRVFSCYKFRTMVADADVQRKKLEHLNERDGILFKITKDPRITRSGLFMRKHSLDELAQLWNVLKGDMSLVGPRPPLVTEVKQYQLDYLRRLDVAPGITGLWQVEARNNPSFDRYISLDLRYVENWSLALDFRIMLRTIAVVCAGTGS